MSEAVAHGVSHSGWALLKGSLLSGWQRRWFVLYPLVLKVYSAPNAELKAELDLKQAVAALDPSTKHPFTFEVKNAKKSLLISASSDAEASEWVDKISRAIRLQYMKVSLAEFEILKVLGSGAYGKVRMVRLKPTGQIFAMKSLSKRRLADYGLIENTLAERNILMSANHPFLVSARYSFQTDTKVFMIMDYIQGGELLERLKADSRFSEDRTRLYTAELVLAIEYLHSINLVHRDLKPENVLFDEKGHCRLTDFGLAKSDMGGDDTTTTFCGTPEYMAPEMVQRKPYTNAVDWWSLGILVFEMLVGYPPFADPNLPKMYRMIVHAELVFPRDISEVAKSFVLAMCQKDPADRLGSGPKGTAEIREHPFFQSIDWGKVLAMALPMPWVPPKEAKTDASQFSKIATADDPNLSYEDPGEIPDDLNCQLVGFTSTNEAVVDRRLSALTTAAPARPS
jgi:serine/threonine protein kinase